MILSNFCVLSQTGPGGVGTNDGTSSLEFWYIADGEPYADGDLVNSVSDRSGNSRTLSAAGIERPTFTETTIGANNMSSFLFALDQELETTYNGNSNENMSFGTAFSYTNNGLLNVMLQHGGRNTIGVQGTHVYTDFVGGSNHNSGTTATSTWTFHEKTFANSGPDRLKFYVNGSNTDNFTHTIENRTSNTWVGGHGTGGGTGLDGSIAEIYKFSRVLNAAERIIISNYMAGKYNIALSLADIYNEDDALNGNYDFDIAGIGQATDGTNHLASKGTGIVTISNATNLDNDEFLIWGHDNALMQASEVADIPASMQARFARVWRVSEVSSASVAVDVGNIDLSFDLSGLGPIVASDLRLLVDTDNDGIFSDETAISGATNIGGNNYQFSGISAITNNLRFTIGTINSSQTPLPIDLISFNAKLSENRTIELNWQTASESNNDFFTVERSANGIHWEKVKQIQGAGNSSSFKSYQAVDFDPYIGLSYYRLKQTDFDGKFEYSQIKSVTVEKLNSTQVEIYPNPATNQILISGQPSELKDILFLTVLGQNVTALITSEKVDESQLMIDISKLNSGVYFVKTKTNVTLLHKQ